MKTVKVKTEKPYDVVIGSGAANGVSAFIGGKFSKSVVVTDDRVAKLTGVGEKSGACFVFAHGEKSKNLSTYAEILQFFAANELTRSDLVIALGGGVVGDTAGFAAATYMRGVSSIQIPTTLLAMLDSSVGGKTGVDLECGKNLVGAFHQPEAVFCDTDFLKSLPESEIKNGLGEAIKYGAFYDADLFAEISKLGLSDAESVITRCIEIKSEIVSKDPFDKGERALLNFGHTLGHAVEKHSRYAVNHGAAVGIGMVSITDFSEKLGITERGTTEKLKTALKNNGMATEYPLPFPELFELARNDKKRGGTEITLALLKKIGNAVLYKTDFDALLEKAKRIYK